MQVLPENVCRELEYVTRPLSYMQYLGKDPFNPYSEVDDSVLDYTEYFLVLKNKDGQWDYVCTAKLDFTGTNRASYMIRDADTLKRAAQKMAQHNLTQPND